MAEAMGREMLTFLIITFGNSHINYRVIEYKRYFTTPLISAFYHYKQTQIIQIANHTLNCFRHEILINISYNT